MYMIHSWIGDFEQCKTASFSPYFNSLQYLTTNFKIYLSKLVVSILTKVKLA